MQRYLTATIATATLLTASLAVAQQPIADTPAQTQVYYYQQPAPATQTQPYYYAQPQPEQRQGFFGRMMELERRKNQAILRFFGLR